MRSSKEAKPLPPPKDHIPSAESLEPAMDGPPSPEGIRAYTEQMKRSSIFGNNSRTNTLTSSTASSRSRESSTDNPVLSRQLSARSRGTTMPSAWDRPESIQIFGKSIFSRRKKRDTHGDNLHGRSASSLAIGEDIRREASAKDRYHGGHSRRGTMTSSHEPRARHYISSPFNFQHVTHTRHTHLPNLQRTTHMELLSEFSAIRASQAPSHGELKGIRAQDLHFENFSSETLTAPSMPSEESDIQPQRERIKHAQSHDNLRSSRSSLSPSCPVALPARTSSRTASVLLETFDPLATTTIERPQTNCGFRKPAPFGLLTPPPPQQSTWSEQQEYFAERPASHAVTTPGDEAWPLASSPSGTFGGTELTDVQEEEEDLATRRRSRISSVSGELKASQSVPALRLKSQAQETLSNESDAASMVPPPSAGLDSWDNAIDYAYDHEAEADCDYQWERHSIDEDDNTTTTDASQSTNAEQPALDLHLEDDNQSIYHGRFRPSLLVPSSLEIPELSPMSNISAASSDPRTPSNFLRPNHSRSPSHASSFKESHGFHLSPSLLIPNDFQSQMDQEALYEEHYNSNATSASMFVPEPCNFSPIDEITSSTASYRSSEFSRRSARSSSSTRTSAPTSRGSQDSIMLLSCSASIDQLHRSSSSSLPDLTPAMPRKFEKTHALTASVSMLNLEERYDPGEAAAPGPDVNDVPSMRHRRYKSLMQEQVPRSGGNRSALPPNLLNEKDHVDLSPVAESFISPPKETTGFAHGRNISAPVLSTFVGAVPPRARAASTVGGAVHRPSDKKRGSYTLFPQV